jgi:hypothetical protein
MLKDYLSTVSLNVITRMVLGKKYLDKDAAAQGGGSVTTPEEFKWMLDRRAVPAQRRAQHRRLHPVTRLDGPAGVHQEDEEAQQDVRPVPGARRGGAQPTPHARGEELRGQGHGRRPAPDRR